MAPVNATSCAVCGSREHFLCGEQKAPTFQPRNVDPVMAVPPSNSCPHCRAPGGAGLFFNPN